MFFSSGHSIALAVHSHNVTAKRPETRHPDEYRGCGSAPASSFQGSLVLPPTGSHGCFQLWATWRMTSCSSEINIHFRLTISVVDKLSSSSFFDLINSLNSLKLFIFRRSRFRDLGTRINIATGKTSQAITPFHFFNNFNFHH